MPKIFDRNKIISLYDNHNIFVLPSYTEGAPKVILESLVRKRPIIIFKDIKHIKLNFKGIFVCDREPKSFRNKIFYILSNYLEIQRQMSKNLIPTKKNFQNKLLKILND